MAGPGMLSLSRTEKYCTKLADEVMKLRGEKALMDFRICIRDDTIPCSKFVMAAHSPMLRAMLTSNMAEVAKQEIRLDHIDKDIIQLVLDYMYCEDVSFHRDQLMALISAADYLQMTELKEMCLDEVPGILDHTNVISWWKEAIKMNCDDIRDKCEKIMAEDFDQVSQETDFLKLDLSEVQEYTINICGEIVDGDLILGAVTRWVNNNEERIPLLEDLLHKIQLDKCSAQGIKAVMKSHEDLLDKTLIVYKLLSNTLANISIDEPKAVNERLVVLGGRDGPSIEQLNYQCWEVSESNIQNLFEVPSEKLAGSASVCKTAQGFALTGGQRSDLCFVFIASTRSWFRLWDMLSQRLCHGSVCINDVLYVMGGRVGTCKDHSDSVEFLVMGGGHWEEGPSMPLSVQYSKVSSLDDKIYLLDEYSSQLISLYINEDNWKELAPLPVDGECRGISLTSAGGRLYAAGTTKRLCAWYNPTTNAWCTGQQPLQVHKYGALAYHSNKLLFLGGSHHNGTDEVEEYDIEKDEWSMCNYRMPMKIYLHHAFILDLAPSD